MSSKSLPNEPNKPRFVYSDAPSGNRETKKHKLSPQMQRVYDLLAKTPDQDVAITDIYKVAYPAERPVLRDLRSQQMRLGSIISRINQKLTEGIVVTGDARRSYRLHTKAV